MRGLSKSAQRGKADRARAILPMLGWRRAKEIAAALGVHVGTVRNWRGLFAHGRVAAARRRNRGSPHMTITVIGQPVSRVDGRRKVTGGTTYAAEFRMPGLAHGAIVRSTVANGRVASIDTTSAERALGVIAVVTHRNAPRACLSPAQAAPDPRVGERLHVLQDDQVNHQGQPIALVIADSLEQAIHAATLVRITCASEPGRTDVDRAELVLPT